MINSSSSNYFLIFTAPTSIWTGCKWFPGDGIGGFEKRIGTFPNPGVCVQKCKGYKLNGIIANAVTVDSKTGKSCYCEFKSTGRNSNRDWKSCMIAPKGKILDILCGQNSITAELYSATE